jgi:HK97 gp10 family phage protein
MKVRMKIEGGDKIARKLQMLAEETARKHLRESALAGAEVIRQEVEDNAPIDRGILKTDIQKEIVKETKARVQIEIGPGDKGWYARLVEFGHKIVVGGTLRSKSSPGKVVGEVPPHPFMGPAFDRKHEEAQKKAAEVLKARLKL